VAYSRAGYTLYFVSYFLGGLLLYLMLRLGWRQSFVTSLKMPATRNGFKISIRPAAFSDPRCPETAGAPTLAFALLALSAICSGLGLVVLDWSKGNFSISRLELFWS